MAKYAQKILLFFCRPCGDYREKTHPHYRSQKLSSGRAAAQCSEIARKAISARWAKAKKTKGD
jgi:hypothetical protein